MADFTPNDQVVCEDGRTGVVLRKHNGVEPGPNGEFYVVVFGAVVEWEPVDNLHENVALDKTIWLSGRATAASARSTQAAIDNVEKAG